MSKKKTYKASVWVKTMTNKQFKKHLKIKDYEVGKRKNGKGRIMVHGEKIIGYVSNNYKKSWTPDDFVIKMDDRGTYVMCMKADASIVGGTSY